MANDEVDCNGPKPDETPIVPLSKIKIPLPFPKTQDEGR